ncbi:FAD binding domain-containing protein [Tribonema minus]|uniref:fumarate reductase (NADH) n=1 Tax=Tribonema minus TaxID=303371 RepID=A0A836CNN3_9STRA|nr:FAD binding domain-containing protein [Tribonema minus]
MRQTSANPLLPASSSWEEGLQGYALRSRHNDTSGKRDTCAEFKRDTVRTGGGSGDDCLVNALVHCSTEAVQWLQRETGVELSDVTQLCGHSAPRTRRPPAKAGTGAAALGESIVSALKSNVEKVPGVTVRTGARLTRLLTADDDSDTAITGVEYEHDGVTARLHCDAVVLATGGFAGDRALLSAVAPDAADMPTTSGPQADGSALRIAQYDANALLVHMDRVQMHPTGLLDPVDPSATTKVVAPEAFRTCGGILLSAAGRRFCNELAPCNSVTAAMQAQAAPGTRPLAYLVLNEEAAAALGPATLSFYTGRGLVKRCASTAAVAAAIGCDASVVEDTLARYGHVASGSEQDPFGRVSNAAGDWRAEQQFIVATVTPCVHYTLGGVAINASCEVLALPPTSASGAFLERAPSTPVVLGLYAAGECTGGLHGADRLAGSALLECVVFGRIAGARAAAITASCGPPLSAEACTPLRLRCKRTLGTRHRLAPLFKPGQYIAIRHTHPLLPQPQERQVRAVYTVIAPTVPLSHSCLAHAHTLLHRCPGAARNRFYSPVSRDGVRGAVTLLIKADPDRGPVQRHLCELELGQTVDVRGPCGGLTFDVFDAGVRRIGLIAGGSGARQQQVSALGVGAEYEEDLVHHPEPGWSGETGVISADVLRRHMYPPGPGTKIVLCGPFKMCQLLKETLRGLGYTPDMVSSYV